MLGSPITVGAPIFSNTDPWTAAMVSLRVVVGKLTPVGFSMAVKVLALMESCLYVGFGVALMFVVGLGVAASDLPSSSRFHRLNWPFSWGRLYESAHSKYSRRSIKEA